MTETQNDPGREPVRHYLGAIDVELGEVTTLDVVAVGFDDDYQEAGALAAVRDVAEHARAVDDLVAPLDGILAPDEHGTFTGEVTVPEAGRHAAEVRLTHEHAFDGEQ